jgi:hypothetical protein
VGRAGCHIERVVVVGNRRVVHFEVCAKEIERWERKGGRERGREITIVGVSARL